MMREVAGEAGEMAWGESRSGSSDTKSIGTFVVADDGGPYVGAAEKAPGGADADSDAAGDEFLIIGPLILVENDEG